MYRFILLTLLTLSVAQGCNSAPAQLDEPVAIKGKATSGGQPMKGYTLTLQPLESGHVTMLDLAEDGTFSGKAIPGTYAYFVAPAKSKAGNRTKIDPAFLEAKMDRTVAIASGKDLDIDLK